MWLLRSQVPYGHKICQECETEHQVCQERSYKGFDEKKFLEEVAKITWWDVYNCNDVDLAVYIFTQKLTDILDRMAPVKKFQIRVKYAVWVCKETKSMMLDRDKAQQTASRSGLDSDWDTYRRLRNQVTSQLRKDKLVWQKENLESCEENCDTERMWNTLLAA